MVSLLKLTKNGQAHGAALGPHSPCSTARSDWRRSGRGKSLFRTAQPRKACVEDSDAFRGSFPGCHAWRDNFGWRRDKCAPSALVAAVCSAATRSEAA
jgi:hypothetical protein